MGLKELFWYDSFSVCLPIMSCQGETFQPFMGYSTPHTLKMIYELS